MQERTTAKKVIEGFDGSVPIKIWTTDIEPEAEVQLKNLAKLPFIAKQGVACMPDVHAGIGSTVGTVIATDKAIIPAAVGVDIGCGMVAVRLSLKGSQLPDSLLSIRHGIEAAIPMGTGGEHKESTNSAYGYCVAGLMKNDAVNTVFGGDYAKSVTKAAKQLGTLGSGNHFVELCIDENDDVWVMLHSGSRGIGNMIGTYYINKAKELMERWHITLPDGDLAYLPQGEDTFEDYVAAVGWAQNYAMENRKVMLAAVLDVLRKHLPQFGITEEAINCHHNYVEKEHHFGKDLWITRKGAIRAREGDLGIIPGSMGQRSYIVRGKGNKEAYCSCSHGAGRKMSRKKARATFTVADLVAQTAGVECRKDDAVLDEIPGSYKDIDVVMENQKALVVVVHTLKAVLCCKGA